MRNESEDIQAVERLGEARDKIVTELRKTIVGMNDVIDEMMIAIFARGHCLLVGVPGLARKFEARLYGYLDYDRQKKSFTRFDMLALGETYGGFEAGLGISVTRDRVEHPMALLSSWSVMTHHRSNDTSHRAVAERRLLGKVISERPVTRAEQTDVPLDWEQIQQAHGEQRLTPCEFE